MQRLLVLLVMVMAAVVLPTAATATAQQTSLGCAQGELVEGRCLAVDDQPTFCEGSDCVVFVEESTLVCPAGSELVATAPLRCLLVEPASQRNQDCPEGARGQGTTCYIYEAMRPGGCPTATSTIDATGNCRRPVAPAAGAFYCADASAQLAGTDCRSTPAPIPSPCPAGSTRFDGACWNMNGLTPPESCAGHEVPGTVELASGLCKVPLAIPTGPASCANGAVYQERPEFVVVDQGGAILSEGPLEDGCVIDGSASIGIAVSTCVFDDDDFDWRNIGDPGLCTRFEAALTATCPTGYSIDDFEGGLCRRVEEPINGSCADGSAPRGIPAGSWCVFAADFSVFDCPAATDRLAGSGVCVAYRPERFVASCRHVSALLSASTTPEFGLLLGCFPLVGPQPDTCNGMGTLADCFQVLEPAPVACASASGCVSLEPVGSFATCNGRRITVDLNLTPPQQPTAGNDVILGTPGDDVINALAGDDSICSGGGNDLVDTGPGNDWVRAGAGDDTLFGGPGNDRLFGVSGADTISGGDGMDTIHGNQGEDVLDGGAGDDRIFGYAGNDTITGGEGDDRLAGNLGEDFMQGGAGDDIIHGYAGNDVISGGDGNDTLHGNFGEDVMNGGSGDDRIFGYGDDDVISGGLGRDIINGNRGNDTLDGNQDNDQIKGADGNDEINGGDGDDTLFGNALDDTIDGGPGIDTCDGGPGTDTTVRCEPNTN